MEQIISVSRCPIFVPGRKLEGTQPPARELSRSVTVITFWLSRCDKTKQSAEFQIVTSHDNAYSDQARSRRAQCLRLEPPPESQTSLSPAPHPLTQRPPLRRCSFYHYGRHAYYALAQSSTASQLAWYESATALNHVATNVFEPHAGSRKSCHCDNRVTQSRSH